MEMKKLRTKQAVICFIGVAVCKLGFAGCYPFIPAYFAAAGTGRTAAAGNRNVSWNGIYAATDTDDKICNDTAGNHSNHQAGRMGK